MLSASLSQCLVELEAIGSTQVLVELPEESPGKTKATGKSLSGVFSAGKESQQGALASSHGKNPGPPYRIFPKLGVMLGTVDTAGFKELTENGGKLGASRVYGTPAFSLIKPSMIVPAASPTTKLTWGLKAMGVDLLWKEGLTGKGVRVAHLDTGLDGNHPALQGAVGAFAEFDMMGTLMKPAPAAWDSAEHGTHTAATIAGRPVRGKHVGVAPGALLASALCIEGGQTLARVLGALEWSLDQKVKVLSMSLGFRGYTEYFLRIVRILRANGILPIIASGNEGAGTSRSPGNYVESLSVGALNASRRIADFSSSQEFARTKDRLVPDLAGPGVGILSAKPRTKRYQKMDGTSMSTPHIAGLAALLFEARPKATVDQVEAAIRGAAGPLKPADQGRATAGLPDAALALKLL